jgi:phage-related protein
MKIHPAIWSILYLISADGQEQSTALAWWARACCANAGEFWSTFISFTLVQLLYLYTVTKKHKYRNVIFYKHHFQDFFLKQRDKVKDRIIWTLTLIEELPKIPETYLKHIEGTDGLYEVRIQAGGDIFRIFCFFDDGKLVVVMNGFQKKDQKTPKKEIDKALKLKKEYEEEKR